MGDVLRQGVAGLCIGDHSKCCFEMLLRSASPGRAATTSPQRHLSRLRPSLRLGNNSFTVLSHDIFHMSNDEEETVSHTLSCPSMSSMLSMKFCNAMVVQQSLRYAQVIRLKDATASQLPSRACMAVISATLVLEYHNKIHPTSFKLLLKITHSPPVI